MAESTLKLRGVLAPIIGALVASAFCVAIAFGFLEWRAEAQRRFMTDRKQRCGAGDRAACDLLRSACLKRSGDGCLALAETCLAPGPRHDEPEGARLLADACEFHLVAACSRAAALYEAGAIPRDLERARALRQRGCALGDANACSKGP